MTVALTVKWRYDEVESVTGQIIAGSIIVEQFFEPAEDWRLRSTEPLCPECVRWENDPRVEVKWSATDQMVVLSWPDKEPNDYSVDLVATIEYFEAGTGWKPLTFEAGLFGGPQRIPLKQWDSGLQKFGPVLLGTVGPVTTVTERYWVTPLP